MYYRGGWLTPHCCYQTASLLTRWDGDTDSVQWLGWTGPDVTLVCVTPECHTCPTADTQSPSHTPHLPCQVHRRTRWGQVCPSSHYINFEMYLKLMPGQSRLDLWMYLTMSDIEAIAARVTMVISPATLEMGCQNDMTAIWQGCHLQRLY